MSEKKLTLAEIAQKKREAKTEERPKKTHATESSKEKAKRASRKFKESKDQITITPPKGFADFLREKGSNGFTKKSMTTVIFEYLEQTTALEEFKEWQDDRNSKNS